MSNFTSMFSRFETISKNIIKLDALFLQPSLQPDRSQEYFLRAQIISKYDYCY
jgi:hypothetical protein